MKKLLLVSLFLPAYVFIMFRSDFRDVNVYSSLFFHLNVFFAVFLAVEGLQRLLKTGDGKRKNTRLVLGATFISILLLEIFLRYGLARHVNYMEANKGYYLSQFANYNESWYYTHFPGLSFTDSRKEFRFDYQINSEGFVDRKHSPVKAPSEFRIIALGDSFTEGVGAEQGASWPARLEQILNDGQGGERFTVIKAGISGSDPFFEYVLLRDRLLKYRPDLVIVALNDSDISEYLVRGGMERFQAEGRVVFRKGPAWEWLYSLSYISRVFVHDILGYHLNLRKGSDWPKDTLAAKAQIHSCLRSFNELAAREGFWLLVVFHPMRWEFAVGQLVLADLAAKLRDVPGMAVLDLLEFFLHKERISQANASRYYWEVDRHHNAAGYAAFARGVAWKLQQMGVVMPIRTTGPRPSP